MNFPKSVSPDWRTPFVILLAGTTIVFLSLGARMTFGLWLPDASFDLFGPNQLKILSLSVALQSLFWGIGTPIAGNIADRMITSGINVTFVRKLMQTIAFGGLATCLLLITLVDDVYSAIGILCLGKMFGAAGIGGFNVNHMDIGPRHAGTLMGITNTVATIPGIVGVAVTGLILQHTGSWDLVFQVTAGVTLFGMVFYLIFAKGEKQFD